MRVIATWLMVLVIVSPGLASASNPGGEEGFCCTGGLEAPGAGGSGSGGAQASISSWVIGSPGGGVSRPQGVSGTCSGWAPATNIDPSSQPSDIGSFKTDPDGVTAILYYRDCGGVRQFVWIRQEPPRVIASEALRDIRTQLLRPPEVATSPPGRAIVNLETWLWITDPGPVSATASIPGLSATVTATVSSTTWRFGRAAASDTGVVTVVCEGVGAPWTPADGDRPAPCGHTFASPTDRAIGHPVEVSVTWDLAWSATNGASGTLDPISSNSAVFDLPVDEIQTIGERG